MDKYFLAASITCEGFLIQLERIPGLEVIKLFSCSTQLSMKFQLLINVEIVKNCGKLKFKTQ